MSNFNDDRKESRANITFNQIKRKRRGTFVVFTIVCLFMASLGGAFTAMVMSGGKDEGNYYLNHDDTGDGVITKESSNKLQEVAGKAVRSVVSIINVINNQNYTKEVNVGVGIVLDSRGYIISSYNNLINASNIKVKSYTDVVYNAEIIGFDTVYDIAMLKVENSNLTPMPMAESPINLKPGDKVISVGNPLGKSYNGSIEVGTVLSTKESVMFRNSQTKVAELLRMIKTTVPPKYINTSAALCNMDGELVGINNTTMAYHNDYLKNSFYISVEDLNQITENILGKQDSMITYLGIYGEAAVSQQEDGIEGVYTKEVIKNGLAYEAGIRPTDIITEVNSISVSSVNDINAVLAALDEGAEVDFTVYKNGIYTDFNIKIPEVRK